MSENISAEKHSHPIVFLFLNLPFGVLAGYVTVTYGNLFQQAGISTAVIASVIAATMIPQIIKFLWAPLSDTTLSLKKWYLLSCILTAAGILSTALIPIKESSIPLLTTIFVISNVAVSFLGNTVNGLAAYDIPEEMKGRVSGYSQAGNLGGSGLGGGAGLWIDHYYHNQQIGAVTLTIACLLCCFGLLYVKEPIISIRTEKIGKTLQNLFKDVWQTVKTKLGWLAMILCFLPLSTGAASNLWAAVSNDWHANPNTVAIATGVASGFITAGGALIGGFICDRMNRQMAYILFGLSQVLCAVGMAYCPHTQLMYIVWTSLYAFTLGLAYAGFSAFVFEAIGKGAAATKFSVYACLSNIPITYMTTVDGWAHTKYGATGMLDTEALLGVVGILLFLILTRLADRKPTVVMK